ncbi:hypothetical protein [Rhodopseudomonas palustris]|uniref:Adenylate cyclase MASE7 domain-containing protein n=1 Tax=Rhodopseudomonas palustris (strain BisB18) TaxID=316056 RepID=Q21BQ5_RHOPB
MLKRVTTWLADYAANEDPLAAAGNVVALVLAGNQPFYPLYVVLLAGTEGLPWVLLTMVSLPFFFSVPAIARRHPRLGRVALALITTTNTVFCSWMLGEPSGTELFLLPCAALAGLLFWPSERLIMLPLAALPVLSFWLLHGHYSPPPHLYTPEGYGALLTMNAVSAGMISIFLGIVFSRLYAAPKR